MKRGVAALCIGGGEATALARRAALSAARRCLMLPARSSLRAVRGRRCCVLNATPGVDLLLTVTRTAQSRRARRARGRAGHHRRLRRACAGRGLRPGGAAGLRRRRRSRCSSGPAPPTCSGWRIGMLRSAWRGAARGRPAPRPPSAPVSAGADFRQRPADQRAQPEGGAVLAGLPAAVHRRRRAAQDARLPGPRRLVRRAGRLFLLAFVLLVAPLGAGRRAALAARPERRGAGLLRLAGGAARAGERA